MSRRPTHVVWDWNGTLFDDVAESLMVANRLLADFGLPGMADLGEYRQRFRFPISAYYADLGFDVSPGGNFTVAAVRYIELYRAALPRISLHADAPVALATAAERGLGQTIVSASDQGELNRQVEPFGLDAWVDGAHGRSDIYAASKEHVARAWLDRSGLDPQCVVFVGDSTHDAEIADALGAACVLHTGGHESAQRLRATGRPVVASLLEAVDAFS